MIDQNRATKAVVTVSEMASMVFLSRARFYDLLGSTFPWPVYDIKTRRPLFVREQQELCLEVRRTHLGVNGKPVNFNARRKAAASTSKRKMPSTATHAESHDDLVAAVRSLGLQWATSDEVGGVVSELFPSGISGLDQGEVIRTVFVNLKRRTR